MTERFLTVYEVAWKLTIEMENMQISYSVRTVRKFLRKGIIPGIKIAGEWRVPEGELVRWIAEKKGIKRDVDYVF